jgi:hypothetical protein
LGPSLMSSFQSNCLCSKTKSSLFPSPKTSFGGKTRFFSFFVLVEKAIQAFSTNLFKRILVTKRFFYEQLLI